MTDPLTKKTFLSCNCTTLTPAVVVVPKYENQSCQCKNVTNATSKTWYWNCNCTNCNKQVASNLTFNQSQCGCNTTSTSANKSCNCSLLVQDYCKFVLVLDENTCDANNKPKNLNTTANNATNCKYQYEYLVAVVATGTNSSVLLQLQSYQLDGAQFL